MREKVKLTPAKVSTKPVKKRKKITKTTRKRKWLSGLFICPSFIGVMTFFVIPFIVVMFYSVVDNPISKNFVFFENFKRKSKNF